MAITAFALWISCKALVLAGPDSVVTFNEIHYHPAEGAAGGEWIELHNQMVVRVDLSGWSLRGGIDYEFGEGVVIEPGTFVVIAADPGDPGLAGVPSVLGPFTGRLDNGGEEIRLRTRHGRLMDRVAFGDAGDWPVGADGGGATLAKRGPNLATEAAASWSASGEFGGTPGAGNFGAGGPVRGGVVLNELGSNWVEVTNRGTAGEALLGLTIETSEGEVAALPDFQLEPGEFQVVTDLSLPDGARVFLKGPGGVRDAVVVKAPSRGRRADGHGPWQYPDAPTPGSANTFTVSDAIVINEIMYHHRPDYAGPAVPLVPVDGIWKYEQSGVDLGSAWREAGFDDATWPSGSGVLGVESSPLPAPIATPLTLGRNTYYFRKTFNYTGDPEEEIRLRLLVDDGAVVYLNGVEVYRENMPEGVIGFATAATTVVGNAAFSKTVTLPSGAVMPGANTLAVEVHQGSPTSSDLVFGLELNTQSGHRENDEEWIELYNRSGAEVDVSGWSLRDAVNFDFPIGTTIPAGGYLVVANDAAVLQAKYPDLAVVGDFGGRLDNRDERLELRDAWRNTVDEVHYYDSGGGWPEFADGGGSSLELIDPDADNAVAGAWADSDEGSKADWTTITYRGTGSEPAGSNNPGNFHEFLMGLLDKGEVLVDDITVTRDPDGSAVGLIQNGAFSAGTTDKWRILGTQEGEVIDDPGGTGQVLRLRAGGAITHTYNTASTTFANGQGTNSGATYEIGLRAKWVAGSPQLNTRLYLNRMARTHILPMPENHGTPGAPNSSLVDNAGPTCRDLAHVPLVPAVGEDVTVSVTAGDPDGIASMILRYAVDGGTWRSVTMAGSSGIYTAQIAGRGDGRVIQFYVEGRDALGAKSFFPRGGPESRALYRVGDGGAGAAGVHSFRIIMTPEEAELLHTEIHAVSNRRLGATVIYNDREVVYGAGVRLRGAPFSRRGTRTGWNIRFGSHDALRGVHSSIALDGGYSNPRGDGGGWVEVGGGAASNELIYNQMANYSGGIGASYDDIAYVDAPLENQNKLTQLKMARFGQLYLDSVYEDGAEGALFKQELIYHPTGTIDGDPESLKNPFSTVRQIDITSMGGTSDSYRFNYLRSNLRWRDDYDGIIAMCEAFDLADPEARRVALEEAVDMDSFMRKFAYTALTCTADTYNQSLAHNLEFYVRPDDGRVVALPWDFDHAFYYGTNANIFGQGAHKLAGILQVPSFRRLYLGHLLDLCQRGFRPDYIGDWVTHFNAVAQQTAVNDYTSWIGNRRNFVLSQLPLAQPPVSFAITTNNGDDFTEEGPAVELTGDGWIDVREIRLAATGETLSVQWLDGDSWLVTVPLLAGVNQVGLSAHDHTGVQVGAASIAVTNPGSVVAPSSSNLVVSELMFHPSAPSVAEMAAGFTDQDDFEFLELLNIGPNPVALAGLHFSEGVDFNFTGASIAQLAPGERVLVVSNRPAFEFRHGGGHPVAGVFIDTRLANHGERLRLADGSGVVVRDFSYNDSHPWPVDADGKGYSLTLVAPTMNPDHGVSTSWRASVEAGGSPGGSDQTTLGEWLTSNGLVDPAGDEDGDGINNLVLYAMGGDLVASPFAALPVLARGVGFVEVSFRERAGAGDVILTPEASGDLIDWQSDPGDASLFEFASSTSHSDGTRTMVYRLIATEADRFFVRVLVQSR